MFNDQTDSAEIWVALSELFFGTITNQMRKKYEIRSNTF